ncbi:MAG: DUF2911 domain-containing protein [Bacteroidia bacterium]
MKRTQFFFIILSVLVFFACAGSGNSTQTEKTDSTDATAVAEAPSTLTVLVDTIPSPKKELKTTMSGADITIVYGSPSVKERTIWGELVPYGEVWRTGANEATTFETSAPISIGGQTLAAGKYGFFTVPDENDWTLIFNEVSDQWGAYNYDAGKDVMRVKVVPMVLPAKSLRPWILQWKERIPS